MNLSKRQNTLYGPCPYRVFWVLIYCKSGLIPANPSGFYHNYNNGVPVRACSLSPLGVRQKIEKDSQCESFLLRSLTPARLISFKQITSDEAESNQLLR